MNILIITDALTQPLYTPRVRFLNQQLLAEGHSVVWYTERSETIPYDIRPDNLIEIPYYNSRFVIIKGILSVLFNQKDRSLLANIKLPFTPDIIFCSSFQTYGLMASHRLAKQNKCPLCIDLRDIAEQSPFNFCSRTFLHYNKIYRKLTIIRRNRYLKKANMLTSVSKFHTSCLSAVNPNSHVIYNGYDSTIFYPAGKRKRNNPVTLLYAGHWYGEKIQNPHPLFRALSHHHEIKVVFYTSSDVHPRLRELADEYDVNLELHSYIPNSEVPALIRTADFSLVLTSPENKGWLTTKFFEALGSGVPILCSPSDNGELAELIRTTNAGLASSDPEEILSFIHSDFDTTNNDNSFFSRQQQTARLISLMKQTI